MTSAERRYLSVVQALGCIVCRNTFGLATPAEIHHIRTGYGVSQRAPHHETLPLCPRHHRTGGPGVAFHAGPEQWQSKFGDEIALLEQTRREASSI